MNLSKLETAACYVIAAAVLGLWIYFLPLLFIGFVCGMAVGINWNNIKAWIEDDDPVDSM